MKGTYYLLLLSLFLLSCDNKKDTSMSIPNEGVIAKSPSSDFGKWNIIKGDLDIDTLNVYKGKNSLRLTSSIDENTNELYALYAYDLSEIDGDAIVIRGKYRIDEAKNAKLYFKMQQYHHIDGADSIFIEAVQNSKWKEFTLKAPIMRESNSAVLYIIGKGDIDILLSDCEARVDNVPMSNLINQKFDAEKDTEFDDGSNIELGELIPQMVDNLEVLGKVWGFLKYYHPQVTQGKYNWDYELFRVLPQIAKAKDKNHRNKLLSKWIKKYGKVTEVVDYTINDSTKYSRFINLSWLNNNYEFDEKLIGQLDRVKNASRSERQNYYTIPYVLGGILSNINREKAYSNIKWNDQGYRILTLFRLWNAIEYCFPYTDYTDTTWEALLKEFIPRFYNPKDQADYELAIIELTARIDDSHGYVDIPNNKLNKTSIAPVYGKYFLPVQLIQSVEGHIVIKSTTSKYLHRGDIIASINGKDINESIDNLVPYIPSSNRNGQIRNALNYLKSSNINEMIMEVIRDKKKIEVHVIDFNMADQSVGIKLWEDYDLESLNIIHVDNKISAQQNRDIVQNNMNSEGLIIDMREYPYNGNQELVAPLISTEYPLWISKNDKSYPGNYRKMSRHEKISEELYNPKYKGKIVILVDENTQSAGESWAMKYRLSHNSVIVGRQTAGANGNIGRILLPGNIEFTFTQLGAYYPNWEILQRKGVKIDVPVSPTVDDIKQGRDIWIEKAIEIIKD